MQHLHTRFASPPQGFKSVLSLNVFKGFAINKQTSRFDGRTCYQNLLCFLSELGWGSTKAFPFCYTQPGHSALIKRECVCNEKRKTSTWKEKEPSKQWRCWQKVYKWGMFHSLLKDFGIKLVLCSQMLCPFLLLSFCAFYMCRSWRIQENN